METLNVGDKVKVLPIMMDGIIICKLFYFDGIKYEVRFWNNSEVKYQVCLPEELELIKAAV